jgi:hypothetical protein
MWPAARIDVRNYFTYDQLRRVRLKIMFTVLAIYTGVPVKNGIAIFVANVRGQFAVRSV